MFWVSKPGLPFLILLVVFFQIATTKEAICPIFSIVPVNNELCSFSSFSLSTTGGVPPFTFGIDGALPVSSPFSLSAGQYTAIAYDQDNCPSSSYSFTVHEGPAIEVGEPLCGNGYGLLAQVEIIVSNYNPDYSPYTFQINGAYVSQISNMSVPTKKAGSVKVTHRAGCFASGSINIQRSYPTCVCPDFYFIDSPSPAGDCSECGSNCRTCQDSNVCTNCASGYFEFGGLCNTCMQGCKECTGSTNCMECDQGLFISDGSCTNCHRTCRTCIGESANECTTCPNGYFLSEGACVSECPAGTYPDVDTNSCVECDGSCKTCSGPLNCISCDDGKFLNSGICYDCDRSCETCSDTETNCNSCFIGDFFYRNSCYATCPIGTLAEPKRCVDCDNNCQTCAGDINHCKSCNLPYYLYTLNNTCVVDCPSGYFEAESGNCEACDSTCTACSSNATDCTSCVAPYLLFQNSCVNQCPYRKYDSGGMCEECHNSCLTCNGSPNTACITCETPYFFYSNNRSCIISCPPHYYETISPNRECAECNNSCWECGNSAIDCISCNGNNFLYNGDCFESCPDGFYGDRGLCRECHSSCDTCSGPGSTNCISCNQTNYYHFADSSCYSVCPDGYFEDGTVCSECDGSCLKCDGPMETNCTTCNESFFYFLPTSSCLPACPFGYYADSRTQICYVCNESCSSCYGTSTNCTNCKNTEFFYPPDGTCLSSCPDHYFAASSVCNKCDDSCVSCSVLSTNCTSCSLNSCYEGVNCSNREGGFECGACPNGYNGTGIGINGCYDFNECSTNPCINKECHNTLGSYVCRCEQGYIESTNGVCIDVDECKVMNGGCDFRVYCNNTIGGFICGPCPLGYSGDGKNGCLPLCGDTFCNSTLGEDCVTCPRDCGTTTFCGKCGDGRCDVALNETCSSCYEDCKSICATRNCSASCLINGRCESGVCMCSLGWSGPNCDVRSEDISVEPPTNSSEPFISIGIPNNQNYQKINVTISIQRLIEKDSSGDIVGTPFDIRHLVHFNISRESFFNSSNVVFHYSATLENAAVINMTFIHFKENTNYTFANATSAYSAGTLKMNFKVTKWPFKSIHNTLDVEMENTMVDTESSCKKSFYDNSMNEENLQWLKISLNGVATYTQFLPDSIIDGRRRLTKFSLISSTTVAATFPHFWTSAEFDPNYEILLEPASDLNEDDCGQEKETQNKISKAAVIGITVGVVVGAALIAGVVALYLSHTRKASFMKKFRHQAEMDSLQTAN